MFQGAACKPFCFRGKCFDSTERGAEVEAVKGGAVAWKIALGRMEE